ncbi:MAG TPA: M20/M25/M40 family metallo-hydrolase [Tissierellia bacterium]|nr:M20/M25/M40 family metallo-hydrolase [Tissierellia bacterium]
MKLIDKIVDFRRELHANPEASMKEVQTRRRIKEFLQANAPGIKIVEKDRWLYGLHDEGAEETYLFRADFDAILHEDGSTFHGCGHDGHTAILAGLASKLDGETLGRNIVFLFQHAEETGEGAIETVPVIEEAQVDKAFALHGMSGLELGKISFRAGTNFCASTGFLIQMKGLQSHASEPEKGNNPAYLMAALTQLVEPLKEFNGFTPRTWNGIEFKNLVMATLVYQRLGEKAFGVSPSTAEMGLTLRAYYEAEIDQLIVAIEEFVKTEAEKKGLTVDFEQLERFPETASDEALVEKIQPLMDQWGFRWTLQEEAMRGSEDFGHIAKLVPSIYFLLGLGEDSPPMHNVAFEFKDEVIPIGLDLFEKIARYGV